MKQETKPTLIRSLIRGKNQKLKEFSINDEIAIALKTPLFDSLHLTQDEIKKNLNVISKIVEEEKKCSLLKNRCCSDTNYHLALKRKPNHELELVAIPCEKMVNLSAENRFKKNFIIHHFNDQMFELRLLQIRYDSTNDSKNEIVKFFNKIITQKSKLTGFYIYGKMGVGKTYFATAFANELARKGYTIAFVFVPELVYTLKNGFGNSENNYNNQIVEQMKTVDVLFLDDVGAEETNIWFYNEYLLIILNHRMTHNLPTFFISNLSLNELEKKLLSKKNTIVNVKRLMERIKALTRNYQWEIIDKNYRY